MPSDEGARRLPQACAPSSGRRRSHRRMWYSASTFVIGAFSFAVSVSFPGQTRVAAETHRASCLRGDRLQFGENPAERRRRHGHGTQGAEDGAMITDQAAVQSRACRGTPETGPVQLLVVGFNEPKFGERSGLSWTGWGQRRSQAVDAVVVRKDDRKRRAQMSDLTVERAIDLGAKAGALIGLASAQTRRACAPARCSARRRLRRPPADADVWFVDDVIPNSFGGRDPLIEHRWASRCVKRSGTRGFPPRRRMGAPGGPLQDRNACRGGSKSQAADRRDSQEAPRIGWRCVAIGVILRGRRRGCFSSPPSGLVVLRRPWRSDARLDNAADALPGRRPVRLRRAACVPHRPRPS
jgi:hypothetical protein